MRKQILASALVLSLVVAPAFARGASKKTSSNASQASQASQSNQSGQASQVSKKPQNNQCIGSKVKESFKKGYEAGKKTGTKTYDSAQNKVMDSGVAVKKKVTGNKDKTWVKGHYKADGTHVKGHWRKVGNNNKK